MTIKEFKNTEAFNLSELSNSITYLVFGGQGSLYVSKLEYCPTKKQVKLLSEPKETYQGPVTVENLLIFPDDTEILIEGYPGDDTTPLEWVTPDNVECLSGFPLDFQRLFSDEEHKIMSDAMEELKGIRETLNNHDIPDEDIKRIFTTVIKDL